MYRNTIYESKIKAFGKIALLLILLGVTSIMWMGRPAHGLTGPPSHTLNHTSPFEITGTLTSGPPLATGRGVRRVYGHSLVPGGILSIDELMAAIERDPQLAEHYKNFDLSRAHIVTLDHDVVAYVSYRLDRGIYWQAKPTIIAQGEQVITDGTTFIRARCGNRISYVPSFPTSLGEPEDTDTAVPVEFVAPPAPADPTTGNLASPGAPPPVPPLVGDLPNGSPCSVTARWDSAGVDRCCPPSHHAVSRPQSRHRNRLYNSAPMSSPRSPLRFSGTLITFLRKRWPCWRVFFLSSLFAWPFGGNQ